MYWVAAHQGFGNVRSHVIVVVGIASKSQVLIDSMFYDSVLQEQTPTLCDWRVLANVLVELSGLSFVVLATCHGADVNPQQ